MVNQHFYPEIEPYAHGELPVGGDHVLYYEQCGNPDGMPIVFLHGGPGAGCTPVDRRFFDPEAFRIVLFDQRGCGRSKPLGSLHDNDIDALVADIELLRTTLGIDRWHVFGGSWGSTLALYYAQEHTPSVLSLVLRGIWLLRAAEIHWWLYEMGWLQPELWRAFAGHVPPGERDDLLEAYWRRLNGEDESEARAAARAWSIYEGSCCTLLPNEEFAAAFADSDFAFALARLEAHYFRNQRFVPDDALLRRATRLRDVPAFAVHGRYDIVCPVRNLLDLQAVWPELSAHIVADAGHSSHEPGITEELVAATRRLAATGTPVA